MRTGLSDSVRSPEDSVPANEGGRSSVVEFQPSKLAVAGSNPVARSIPSLLDRERSSMVRDRMKPQVSLVASGPSLLDRERSFIKARAG
jgi:hypothetical protein